MLTNQEMKARLLFSSAVQILSACFSLSRNHDLSSYGAVQPMSNKVEEWHASHHLKLRRKIKEKLYITKHADIPENTSIHVVFKEKQQNLQNSFNTINSHN